MKQISRLFYCSLTLTFLTAPVLADYVLPDEALAGVLGQRAKSAVLSSESHYDRVGRRAAHRGNVSSTSSQNLSDKCGHLEIGNTDNQNRNNQKTEIIILGDIYNMGNYCR